MKYTYQISFNGSDYTDLTRRGVQMQGAWIEGTKIWRENISELKITKRENSSTYDTLESWWDDSSKFETRIFIKVLKNSVEDSMHWFGIKWGKINKDTGTYTVEPLAYDLWAQYFEAILDLDSTRYTGVSNTFEYYDTTANYPYVAGVTNEIMLEGAIKHYLSNQTGWSSSDIVSSFLWQDNYEDTSAVGTFQGMPLDYVTGKHSILKECGLISILGRSVNDVINWLKLFRSYIYFDSNDKLRIEHIKFFNDKLEDNAVDYSADIKIYDDKFFYNNVEIPTSEQISINTESEDSDVDFNKNSIIYNTVRNRTDAQSYSFSSELKTNLGYVGTTITDDLYIFGAIKNQVYKFTNVDMLTFDSDFNYIDISWNPGLEIRSNDFYASGGASFDFYADMTGSFSGSYQVQIRDRSSSALISNTITVTTAIASGTLTLTTGGTPTPDAYFRLIGGSSAGSMQGWITLKPQGSPYRVVIPTIDGIISGNAKSNGALSVGNIIDSWWQDDRLSRSAVINGSDYDFNSTQFNLIREDIRVHISDVPNPLYGFNDGTRIAQIEKWTRDLDTDYYTISLTYQEDE